MQLSHNLYEDHASESPNTDPDRSGVIPEHWQPRERPRSCKMFMVRLWTIPFELSSRQGGVTVRYGENRDPAHWGYDLLGLKFPWEVSHGFPVVSADVAYEGDGYAAIFGWVQVVWMSVVDKPTEVLVDVAPQLIGSGVPYISFGVKPTMFDAPSTTDREVQWAARTFLTASPDRLMTRVLSPVVGFRWGYTIRAGDVAVADLVAASGEDWLLGREVLTNQFPGWQITEAFHPTAF